MFAIKRSLKLNNRQATLIAKHAGLRRVVFNMGLSLRTQMYGRVKLSDSKVIKDLKKVLTNHVKKQPGFAWMNQVSSRVYQNALIDLKDAFNRYRSSLSGHPTFASGRDGQSFTVDSSNPLVVLNAGNRIKIPTVGTFQGHEPLECGLVSQTFTLSTEGSHWFVSFCVDAERLSVEQTQESVGMGLGIKAFFATMSKNQVFDALKPLKQAKNKLAIQRQASKQVKCSNNQRQTYNKMTRINSRSSGISKELLHKLTTPTVKSLKLIKIGELNVKGMMANPKLGLARYNLGFYEFRRQLEYKCKMYGATRVLVDQWFPSSLTCSICGNKQDIHARIRTYDCPSCGISIDRDLNASLNIWELGTLGSQGESLLILG
jgi:putative transposase